MNRLIKGVLCGAIGLGGVASSGCMHGSGEKEDHYSKFADPCWPERYASQARELKVAAFEPQVTNGHILDQTIWNMHFDAGSEKLNAAGMDKLDQLARRRPNPDPVVYLQTTRDIPYDADNAAEYVTKRGDLDSKRVASIQKYLGSTLSGRASAFNVEIHDPSYPGIEGASPRVIFPTPRQRATGAGSTPSPAVSQPRGGITINNVNAGGSTADSTGASPSAGSTPTPGM